MGLFSNAKAGNITAVNAQRASGLDRLDRQINKGVTGLDQSGLLAQSTISDIGNQKIGDFSQQQQGSTQNSINNAALSGGISSGLRNQLLASGSFNQAQGIGRINQDIINAQSQSNVNNLQSQQDFLNNASLFVPQLDQKLNIANANNQNKANIANLRKDVLQNNTPSFFENLAGAAVGGLAGGFGGGAAKKLFGG